MKDKETRIEFKVIDNNTGKEADISKIALKEDWAKDLMYCDMQGFAILDDGNLILLDECGKFEYCPSERFSIKFEDSVVLSKEEYDTLKAENDKYVKDCIDYIATISKLENKVWEVEQQARKETAEKLYKLVDSKLDLYRNCVIGGTLYDRGYQMAISDIKQKIKDIFGVEIKE